MADLAELLSMQSQAQVPYADDPEALQQSVERSRKLAEIIAGLPPAVRMSILQNPAQSEGQRGQGWSNDSTPQMPWVTPPGTNDQMSKSLGLVIGPPLDRRISTPYGVGTLSQNSIWGI